MDYWWIADTHLGHKNIIKLCNRPFASIEEHDEILIENWNDRVKAGDIVYHLGDFSFESPKLYLPRLNGTINLLFGNHDSMRWWSSHKNYPNVRLLNHYHELKIDNKLIVLCHYAMRVWNKSHHGAYMFYGHSHGTLPGNSQSLDVGVDCWDFSPTSLGEIEERLKTLPPYGHVDHHTKGTNP